jgi:DNA-directed RNA polymerase subunit RPC12/RpoP
VSGESRAIDLRCSACGQRFAFEISASEVPNVGFTFGTACSHCGGLVLVRVVSAFKSEFPDELVVTVRVLDLQSAGPE